MNNEIYQAFYNHLKDRLEKKVFTTEDSVRYSFFAALLSSTRLTPSNIVLEYPHEGIPGAEVDTYIPQYDGHEVIIEFKYDRAMPGGGNLPRTQKAGSLFKDIGRLTLFIPRSQSKPTRLFIHMTDGEMATYMGNAGNGLDTYFNLPVGSCLRVDLPFFQNKAAVFQRSAGQPFKATLIGRFSGELPNRHFLRIFEIQPDGEPQQCSVAGNEDEKPVATIHSANLSAPVPITASV